jgi:HK97 family phage major capsid protein
MTSDPTFTWTDPDSQSDATPSTPDLGTVRLQAKSLRGYVTLPNDLIRYSTPSAELVIRAALGGGIATAEDLAFLENAGSTIAPRGIRHFPQSAPETPTDGKVTLHVASTVGADGDVLEPEDLALIISLFEEGKDPDPPTAWMMRPAHFAVLANRRADAVNVGDKKGGWMFPMSRGELGGTLEKVVSGYRAVTTTQLTRSDTKGSATNLNVILFGNFNRCLIARAGAFSLDASPHIKFLQDKIVLRAILRTDFNMEYCPSLVITRNLLQS